MKRLFGIFILNLLLLPSVTAQYSIEDIEAMFYSDRAGVEGFLKIWSWDILKGNVKSIRDATYRNGELEFYRIRRFNDNQQLISESIYNRKDTTKLDHQSLYTYNDRGELILKKYVNSRYDETDTTYSHTSYTYSDKGVVVKKEFFRNDDNSPYSIEEYNEQGQPIYYLANRDSESFYIYDKNSKLSKIEDRDKNYSCILKHDTKGRLIGLYSYDKDGLLDTSQSFEYDRKGRIVKEINEYADTSIYSNYERLVFYDKKNRMIKIKRLATNSNSNKKKLEWLIDYIYDKQGNMVEFKEKNSNLEYDNIKRYTYDEFGNWILSKSLIKEGEYTSRIIEYY